MMKLRGRSRRPGAIRLEIEAKQGATIGFHHRNAEGKNLPLLLMRQVRQTTRRWNMDTVGD